MYPERIKQVTASALYLFTPQPLHPSCGSRSCTTSKSLKTPTTQLRYAVVIVDLPFLPFLYNLPVLNIKLSGHIYLAVVVLSVQPAIPPSSLHLPLYSPSTHDPRSLYPQPTINNTIQQWHHRRPVLSPGCFPFSMGLAIPILDTMLPIFPPSIPPTLRPPSMSPFASTQRWWTPSTKRVP